MIEPDFTPALEERVITEEVLPGIRWRLVECRMRLAGVRGKRDAGLVVRWREWQGELVDIDRVTDDPLAKSAILDCLKSSRRRRRGYKVALPVRAVPAAVRPPAPPDDGKPAIQVAPDAPTEAVVEAVWAALVERYRSGKAPRSYVDAVARDGKFVIRDGDPENYPASALFESTWARLRPERKGDEQVLAALCELRDRLERRLLELGLGPESEGSDTYPHPCRRFRYLCARLDEISYFIEDELLIYPALSVAVTFAELWTELRLLEDALRGNVVRAAAAEGGCMARIRRDPEADVQALAAAIAAGATLREAARRIAERTGAEPATLERAYRQARKKNPRLPAPQRGRPRRKRDTGRHLR